MVGKRPDLILRTWLGNFLPAFSRNREERHNWHASRGSEPVPSRLCLVQGVLMCYLCGQRRAPLPSGTGRQACAFFRLGLREHLRGGFSLRFLKACAADAETSRRKAQE